MLQYLIKRLLMALPVILGITLISYMIISAAPGDAVDLMIDPNMSANDIAKMREELGLNDPWLVRYGKWVTQAAQGNLGYSMLTRKPVAERVAERFGPTLLLTGSAFLVAYSLAIPIGVISATRQYSPVDYASTVFGLLGNSTPGFFLGLGMIYIFALKLDLFPSGGMLTVGTGGGLADRLQHLVLPMVVLAAGIIGNVMRQARSAMLEVVRQDYIRTARAKGLAERVVLYKHGLRNALIPVITLAGLQFPMLLGGAIITEQVFSWPGMGRLAIDSITQRDYPVIMALNLITAFMVLAGQLVSDLMYSVVDPRIRYS